MRRARPSSGCRPCSRCDDLLSGERFQWRLGRNYVRLEPGDAPGARLPGASCDVIPVHRASSRRSSFAVRRQDRGGAAARRRAPRRGGAGARRRRGSGSRPTRCGSRRAVFYEIHIRGFFDANGDGLGDFRGPDREARLPPVARDRLHLAAAVLRVAAARRRLRHRRLLRGPPRLRHGRGRAAADQRRARPRGSA